MGFGWVLMCFWGVLNILSLNKNRTDGTENGHRSGINILEVPAKQGFLGVPSKYIRPWCEERGISVI